MLCAWFASQHRLGYPPQNRLRHPHGASGERRPRAAVASEIHTIQDPNSKFRPKLCISPSRRMQNLVRTRAAPRTRPRPAPDPVLGPDPHSAPTPRPCTRPCARPRPRRQQCGHRLRQPCPVELLQHSGSTPVRVAQPRDERVDLCGFATAGGERAHVREATRRVSVIAHVRFHEQLIH